MKKKLMWRGGELTTIGSKSNLTSLEMGEFIGNVILEANELGITVPDPDKNWSLEETLTTLPASSLN